MQIGKFKISMSDSKNLFLIFNFAFLIFNFLLVVPAVYAADSDWLLHIKVSVPDSRGTDGTVWNHLIAGIKDGATDGFDRKWDTLSMAEVDDPVQSMFIHGTVPEDNNNDGVIDNWGCKGKEEGYSDYDCSLWRDVRTLSEEKVWTLLVMSTVNSGTITLQWNLENKIKDIDVMLVDLSDPNNVINMKNATVYSYTNTFNSGKKYGIRRFEIRMNVHGFFIAPPGLPDATIGSSYGKKLSIVGAAAVWSLLDGNLPAGMSLDKTTGEITGTPTETGIFKFTLKAEDPSTGNNKIQEYELIINSLPAIDLTTLPDGATDTYYSGQITVTGGTKPITWSVIGNLPEGLLLDKNTGIISGTGIVPGIYDFTITIKDANGAVDSKVFHLIIVESDDKTPPDLISDLRVAHITNSSVLLIWSAPLDDSKVHTAAVYDIRYVEDCSSPDDLQNDPVWDMATAVVGEPRPQFGALQTYTLTGVKAGVSYCIAIKSKDAMGHVSGLSNVVKLPLSPDMKFSTLSELTSTIELKRGYNLISIPMIPVFNERESLFSMTVGSPVALYRWYSAYPDITSPQYYLESIVQPGAGYFLYSPADNVRLVIDGLQIDDKEYVVTLENGWNMIGNPYTKTILLSDIIVKKTGSVEIKSYLEAVKSGWIGNSLYQLKDGNYDFASFNDDSPASLDPWVGYWINVNEQDGVEIIFRRP